MEQPWNIPDQHGVMVISSWTQEPWIPLCVLRFAHTLGKDYLNHGFKQVAISCLAYENYIDGGWTPREDKANCLLKKKKKKKSSHKLSFKCRPSFSLLKRKLLLKHNCFVCCHQRQEFTRIVQLLAIQRTVLVGLKQLTHWPQITSLHLVK